MAIYGQDLYGKSYYGADVVASYSVEPVTAVQTGYGEITLYWTTPVNTSNWSKMRLIRNTKGFPSAEDDGDISFEITSAQTQSSYTDSGLVGGKYYYYSWFIASSFPPYSASTTYHIGDTVSSGGSNWLCVQDNTLNVTPTSSTMQWSATNETSLWNRAGQAMSLAVADYGYRGRLVELTPSAYATSNSDVTAPLDDDETSQLYRYLSVLAWALDMARTELGEEQHLHRVETMPLARMERMAAELGTPQEASITPRLRRYRVANSALLARRKGTLESVREAVYAATGYDVDITVSGNLMLDSDQAEFRYPRFAAWDPSIVYAKGDVVSYNGFLYTAQTGTTLIEAESAAFTTTAPAAITVGNRTTATYSNNQQLLVQSNAVGQQVTFTITVPGAGTYDLAIGMTSSYDYGISNFQIDGVAVSDVKQSPVGPAIGPVLFNGYAAVPSPAVSVYLGSHVLSSGNHTITVSVQSKDGRSGTVVGSANNGYQMGIDWITYVPRSVNSIVGAAPSGDATNNSFWTYRTAAPSHALDNPLTGGISSWEQVSYTVGATASNANLSVFSGYLDLNGGGDHTGNLAVMTNGTGVTATLAAHSIPHAKVSAWDSAVVYPKNSYVSYNGVNYLSLLPTQGDEPDADLTHWQPEVLSTNSADRYFVSSYGLPLAQTSVWSAGVTYATGQVVQHQGQRYVASTSSHGQPPTGRPTDNLVWAWLGTARDTYTASAWTQLYGGGTTTTSRSMLIEWYDTTGTLITSISPTSAATADLLVTFARNSANLAADAGAKLELNGGTWTTGSTDTPVSYSGMAYWATRNDTSTNGRHLTTNYGVANVGVGLTFLTQPPSGVEHGLLMRWSSTSNFLAASRTRLTKTVAGVTTTLASWTALPNGARIYATLQGSAVAVYSYQGPGLAPVQLASVTESSLTANTNFGIFERAA